LQAKGKREVSCKKDYYSVTGCVDCDRRSPKIKATNYAFGKTEMTHLSHWNITKSPFAFSGTKEWFFAGTTVEEALARIGFLVGNRRRFGIVVGCPGVGRTTLFRNVGSYIARHDTKAAPRVFVVSLSRSYSIAKRLVEACGWNCQGRNRNRTLEDSRFEVEDLFVALKAQNEHVTLLLDDIHLADDRLQDELSWLLRLDAPLTCIASVNESALTNVDPGLLDRCELRVDLPRWDLGQTAEYIEAALEFVGAAEDVFDSQSVIRIQELSNGIPRRISQLAELCLVAGAVQRADQITSEIVEEISQELPGIASEERSIGSITA
jgi:type II secretory pathway predicted ATPase ExeA